MDYSRQVDELQQRVAATKAGRRLPPPSPVSSSGSEMWRAS